MKKRLRKKKRLGEFQELGFDVSFKGPEDEHDFDQLFDAFLRFVEDHEISAFGGGGYGSMSFTLTSEHNRGSLRSEHQTLLRDWGHRNALDIKIGPLIDLWHGDFEDD